MSTKQKATDEPDPKSGNVEQIREILFGGQIRAFDERFELLESRLAKESAALRKALEERVLKLEQMLGEDREAVSDQISTESSNRDLALNKVELALVSTRMDAENQIAQLQDKLGAAVKAIRSELKAAQKELSAVLTRAEKAQDRRLNKLDQNKVDCKELSNFFNDIAKKIQPGEAKQGK